MGRPCYAGLVSHRYRLNPPRVEVPAPLAWVVARGLGPPAADRRLVDPRSALDLARSLDLDARIAARTPHSRLIVELGEAAASEFRTRMHQVAASVLVLGRGAHEVGEAAKAVGVPVVFLKGMAMHLSGRSPLGSRRLSDVDALVPRAAAEAVQTELTRRGWRAADYPPSEHQLPPIMHPSGPVVEVHRAMRGVHLASEWPAADAEDLIAAGLAEPAPGLPENCHIPTEDALAAHLLVHGLAQHLLAVGSYPLLRLIADLQDLQWNDARWAAFHAGPYRWIARDVPPEAVRDAARLAALLASGESPAQLAGADDGIARFLRHALAAHDVAYRNSLRWRAVTAPGGADHRRSRLFRTAWHAVWLTNGQIDVIYGRPRTRLGYWARRLSRPFDLARRGLRYGVAWARRRLAR